MDRPNEWPLIRKFYRAECDARWWLQPPSPLSPSQWYPKLYSTFRPSSTRHMLQEKLTWPYFCLEVIPSSMSLPDSQIQLETNQNMVILSPEELIPEQICDPVQSNEDEGIFPRNCQKNVISRCGLDVAVAEFEDPNSWNHHAVGWSTAEPRESQSSTGVLGPSPFWGLLYLRTSTPPANKIPYGLSQVELSLPFFTGKSILTDIP